MADASNRSWFLIPAGVVLLVVLGVWMARQVKPASRDHTGEDSVKVVLDAPDGDGVEAAKLLMERLLLLGISAEMVKAEPGSLDLRLRRVREPRALLEAALTAQPLTFYVIPEPQREPQGDDADAGKVDPLNPVAWILGQGRAATRALEEPSALSEGESFALECIPPRPRDQPAPCALWRVEGASPLTAEDISEATLTADRRTEEPLITFTFAPGAEARWAALRERAGGQQVAVVAFGEVAARPRVSADPPEGLGPNQWRFSTRTGDTDRPTAIERAERINAASRLKPLPRLMIREVVEAPAMEPPRG